MTSSDACIVGAYTESIVKCRPHERGTLSFMIRSLTLVGRSILSMRLDLIAKPTPPSRLSPSGFPTQKSVKPDFISISWSSPDSRVSDRAAMSMFSLCSSFVTNAVLRSGLSDFS